MYLIKIIGERIDHILIKLFVERFPTCMMLRYIYIYYTLISAVLNVNVDI